MSIGDKKQDAVEALLRSWCFTYLDLDEEAAKVAASELRIALTGIVEEMHEVRFYRGPLAEVRPDVVSLNIVRFADLRIAPDDGKPWNGVERRKEKRK